MFCNYIYELKLEDIWESIIGLLMLIGKSEDVNMRNALKWPAGVLSKSNSVTGFHEAGKNFAYLKAQEKTRINKWRFERNEVRAMWKLEHVWCYSTYFSNIWGLWVRTQLGWINIYTLHYLIKLIMASSTILLGFCKDQI